MLDKDIIEEARGYLDKDKWHLTSVYDSEEDGYSHWKLFRKYKDDEKFYYSNYNQAILSSEDNDAEDLLKFAKEYGGVMSFEELCIEKSAIAQASKLNNLMDKQRELYQKKQEEIIKLKKNRLLELCMYALIRDTKIYKHELDDVNKLKLMSIIINNLKDDTYTLRNKLLKSWGDGDNNERNNSNNEL